MIVVLLIVGLIGSVLWIIGWIRAAVGTVSQSMPEQHRHLRSAPPRLGPTLT